ncbi:NUDIX hydrolase [Streptomyces venezuelae]|uniref:NUDIX hydrolase n=1 Tax=Streptomyces venezuelae TaxID=54571 RepID=UPI003324052E
MNPTARTSAGDIAGELRRRAENDQEARQQLLHSGSAGDLFQVDAENTTWLKAIIAEHGWPGFALVGDQGAEDAWLLVQHADRDPDFQREALELLKAAVTAADASPRHLAYLTDRVLVGSGEPQLYGTQYTGEGESLRPQPVHTPEHLDARRAAVGLEPAAAYDQRMRAAQTKAPTPEDSVSKGRRITYLTEPHEHIVQDNGVVIVAEDDQGRIALIRQTVPLHGGILTVPGGGIEDGEDPLGAAKRELEEEAGLTAATWTSLGTTVPMTRSTMKLHMFAATALSDGVQALTATEAEQDLTVEWTPRKEAVQTALDGGIPLAGAALALLIWSART